MGKRNYRRLMEVVSKRAALLCNYEVLTLLRELEEDHLARAKTAFKVKKEEGASSSSGAAKDVEVSENLRTTANNTYVRDEQPAKGLSGLLSSPQLRQPTRECIRQR